MVKVRILINVAKSMFDNVFIRNIFSESVFFESVLRRITYHIFL